MTGRLGISWSSHLRPPTRCGIQPHFPRSWSGTFCTLCRSRLDSSTSSRPSAGYVIQMWLEHTSLAHAMLSLARDDAPGILPPDLPLLSRLFRQMVHDESIEGQPATPITWVQVPETVVATCNFCSTAIWNRHVRCSECVDFDLCLACYLSGRSCEHSQSYSWAEIHPPERCTRILVRAREILGFQPEEPHTPDRKKTLGTAVNDLMKGAVPLMPHRPPRVERPAV